MPHYPLYIDGSWRDGGDGRRFDAINPYTRAAWATVAEASAQDCADAIAAARRCFETTWSRTSGYERAKLINRLADLLEGDAQRMGELESTDNGKIIRETKPQMGFAARQYRFFAGFADKLFGAQIPLDQRDVFDYATLEPLGVVVLITAWNSPMGLLANKLAPALAAGNCVVVKPSEHASVTTLEFCRLAEAAGFPPGVINVVCGGAPVGQALVGGDIDKVSFTGSPAVGRAIAAQAGQNLKPVTLELGGKSPNIVFADANFDQAVVGALAGIFGAAGQTCIAGSRLLVERPIYARMVEALAARARTVRMGDPLDPATDMGTAANQPQFERILGFIAKAREEGAKLVAGGQPATGGGLERGFFVEPTIFADVDNAMHIARQEVFGPVLGIIPFEGEEEALRIANDSPYGLAAGVWTQNVSRVLRMTRAIRAGQIWVNTYRALVTQAPFGGFKDSGFGREKGEAALHEFLAPKNVMIDFSEAQRDPFAMRT
ncbi:MAG: aldehyde dehydrogenase [Burkholderiaceae bacterium]|nr:aldehyde dehydrogenase [Burkholderiaceae bacterium]MEB2351193.1 aldehyde dehydrogenase [Burkholderiaceae bacterium]